MKYYLILFLIFLLFSCSNKVTQQIDIYTASLEGTIVLENGSPDTLTITINASLNDSILFSTNTLSNGYFIIKNMPPGEYNIDILFDSFYYSSKNLTASLFIKKRTNLGEIFFNRIEPTASLEGYVKTENNTQQNTTIKLYYQSDNGDFTFDKTIFPDSIGYYYSSNLFPRTIKLYYDLQPYDPITKIICLEANTLTTIDTVFFENIQNIPKKTINIDGTIDPDWEAFYTNNHQSNWSNTNDFDNFYIACSNDTLYLAVDGGFDNTGNCVNIYIDKDYKSGTGISDFTQISGGTIGDHLRKNVTVNDNFGADLAFTAWALSSDIAVVSLKNPSQVNENLLNANFSLTPSVIEIAIPLSEIYSDKNFPAGQKIAIIAIIGGGGDQYIADDTIPQQTDVSHFTSVLKMKFPDNP